jgi:hypothetical protein
MLVPNLLGRHLADQQVSKQAACSIPTASPPSKKINNNKKKPKLNNKQGTEKEHATEGAGWCSKCTGGGGRCKELISM